MSYYSPRSMLSMAAMPLWQARGGAAEDDADDESGHAVRRRFHQKGIKRVSSNASWALRDVRPRGSSARDCTE
jgi:hypothetical protein